MRGTNSTQRQGSWHNSAISCMKRVCMIDAAQENGYCSRPTSACKSASHGCAPRGVRFIVNSAVLKSVGWCPAQEDTMAETAGLALGVVSLGLEICKGIVTYVDAVRDKTKGLDSLASHALTLSETLGLLRGSLGQLKATGTATSGPLLATICKSIALCEKDLVDLRDFVSEHAVGCALSSPSLKEKCREGSKALKYGLWGAKRAEVERKLTTINVILMLGLQALDL